MVLTFCSITNTEVMVNPLVGLSERHLARTHHLQLRGIVTAFFFNFILFLLKKLLLFYLFLFPHSLLISISCWNENCFLLSAWSWFFSFYAFVLKFGVTAFDIGSFIYLIWVNVQVFSFYSLRCRIAEDWSPIRWSAFLMPFDTVNSLENFQHAYISFICFICNVRA